LVTVVTPLAQEVGADDATYNSAAFTSTQTWQWTGTSTNSSTGAWTGFRFKIPASIDRTRITDVRLVLTTLDGAGSTATVGIRVEQGPASQLSSSGARRPDTLWASIGAGSGDTAQVAWTHVGAAADATNTSPNISAAVVAALASINQSTEYLNVMIGPTGSTTERYRTFSHDDGTPARRPSLVVTTQVPPQSDNVTLTAPSVGFAADDVTAYAKYNDVSYHDGVGNSSRRVADVFLPGSTPPAGGWPVVLFTHGGGFNAGSEEDVGGNSGAKFMRDCMSRGFAVVSVRYKLTVAVLDTNTGWTRPHSVQDVLCATKWLATQSTYPLDTDFIVAAGYSAGGHLMLEACLLAYDSTPNAYSAVYAGQNPGAIPGTTGPLGSRFTGYPALNHTEGRTGIPTVKGFFSFGGPVKLTQVWTDNTVIRPVLNLYYGGQPSTGSLPALVGGEGDIDSYLTAASGTIYSGRTASAPSFPIGITYSTNDTTVPTSGSYTPLRSALNSVGYDVSQDSNGNVATGVALSRQGYAGTGGGGGHDTITLQYDSGFFTGWLDEVIALQSGDDENVTVTAPPSDFFVPTVGTAGDGNVTTTAPLTDFLVPTPGVATASNVTTVAPQVAAALDTPASSGSRVENLENDYPVDFFLPALTVTVVSNVTTTAPLTDFLVPTPGTTGTADGGATTDAPSVDAVVPAPSTVGDSGVTTVAPLVGYALDAVAVSVSTDVGTAAVELLFGVPTPAASGSSDAGATTDAPALSLLAPTVEASSSGAVTTTAPVVDFLAPTPDISSGAGATTDAPAGSLLVADPVITATGTVTTVAPVVAAAPAPVATSTGAIYAVAAHLLPPRWAAALRRSGWAARLKG
jgi:hypothetical protein